MQEGEIEELNRNWEKRKDAKRESEKYKIKNRNQK